MCVWLLEELTGLGIEPHRIGMQECPSLTWVLEVSPVTMHCGILGVGLWHRGGCS